LVGASSGGSVLMERCLIHGSGGGRKPCSSAEAFARQ
jgi:hypothetical protein